MSNSVIPVLHYLLKFAQIHARWVSDAIYVESVYTTLHQCILHWFNSYYIEPFHPLPSLLLLPSIIPSITVFANESVLHIRWPKYWSQLQHQSFQWIFRTISFRIDWLDRLAAQGTLRSLLQHHISKASVLWHSAFFIVQLSHPYMTAGKTIALNRWTFIGKVMSLLFNMLSRLIIAFLPRS